eukprot:3634649-Rhodomonas_salina.1
MLLGIPRSDCISDSEQKGAPEVLSLFVHLRPSRSRARNSTTQRLPRRPARACREVGGRRASERVRGRACAPAAQTARRCAPSADPAAPVPPPAPPPSAPSPPSFRPRSPARAASRRAQRPSPWPPTARSRR